MLPLLERRDFLARGAGAALMLGPPSRHRRADGVVNGHPAGAEAGLDVLAGGGNAVDAIVAAALVAGVVDVTGCGPGGYGGHLVIAPPQGEKVVAIDFNSAAPAAARPGMFADAKGAVKGNANTFGWLASGVPGTLAGLQLALDRHGTWKFAEVVRPAVRHAREGMAISRPLARTLLAAKARLGADAGMRGLFVRDGRPLREGERYRNPDLADLLERLAADGSVEAFYRGPVARRIAAAFARHGGLVTEKDLASYRAREVTPLAVEYNGWAIHTAPLTAGGLTVLQTIRTLDALGWREWKDRRSARGALARLEAMRLAWDDRLRLLGDPDHARGVPTERLLSAEYARSSAGRVRKALASGRPLAASSDGRGAGGTVHLSAVDGRGMMVALTLTHGGALGAQVAVPGLGLILGHGMSRFDPRRDHPNSPGPGKRPLHNMCPTVALRGGRPALAVGGRGGRRIPNAVLAVLLARAGEGLPLASAVAAPRLHTEGGLEVTHDASWPADEVKRLKEVGFVPRAGTVAIAHAVERDPRTGEVSAAGR